MRYTISGGLALFIFTFIMAGCDALRSGGPDTDLIPIEEGIVFTVQEPKPGDADDIRAELKMKTRDIYRCLGYSLASNLDRDGSNLKVQIYGVEEPGDGVCAMALGPATQSFPLDLEPGNYSLTFTYRDTYHFELVVTDSTFDVSGNTNTFITANPEAFRR